MRVVKLSDGQNVAILAETFTESLASLGDKTHQRAVLKRIHALLSSSSPQHFIYETVEGCDELEVIRAGDDRRIFCRLVMGVPHGAERYNVLFVFYVDRHEYRSQNLQRLDAATRQRLRDLRSSDSIESVERYFENHHAFTAAQIADRIDRLD